MNSSTNTGLKVLSGVLMLIGVILCILTMADDGFTYIGSFIAYSYILLGVAALAWIATFFIAIASNPAKIKGILIWVVGLGVVFGLSYALSTGSDFESFIDNQTKETMTTASISHLSGTGIIMFYILFVGAVLSIVFSSVTRLIR